MSRMLVTAILIGLAVSLAGSARADRLGKGRSLLEIGIGGHSEPTNELGGQLGYFRFLSDQWTLGVSGGYYVNRLKSENSAYIQTVNTHSFTIRVGGDRYAFINDDVALYAGPGVLWARGHDKSEVVAIPPTVGSATSEGDEDVVGFNGRIGMYARLSESAALYGHIGQVLSHSSQDFSASKFSSWSNSLEGSVGLAFDF